MQHIKSLKLTFVLTLLCIFSVASSLAVAQTFGVIRSGNGATSSSSSTDTPDNTVRRSYETYRVDDEDGYYRERYDGNERYPGASYDLRYSTDRFGIRIGTEYPRYRPPSRWGHRPPPDYHRPPGSHRPPHGAHHRPDRPQQRSDFRVLDPQ